MHKRLQQTKKVYESQRNDNEFDRQTLPSKVQTCAKEDRWRSVGISQIPRTEGIFQTILFWMFVFGQRGTRMKVPSKKQWHSEGHIISTVECSERSGTESVAKLYAENLSVEKLSIQIRLLPSLFGGKVKKVTNIDTIFQHLSESTTTKRLLSEIDILLRIYLTILVTTATPERSFSSLRRIKTFLCGPMTQEHLHNWMLYYHKLKLCPADLLAYMTFLYFVSYREMFKCLFLANYARMTYNLFGAYNFKFTKTFLSPHFLTTSHSRHCEEVGQLGWSPITLICYVKIEILVYNIHNIIVLLNIIAKKMNCTT